MLPKRSNSSPRWRRRDDRKSDAQPRYFPSNTAVDEFVTKSGYDHAKTVFEKIDEMEPKSKKTWRKKQELCRYPDIPCEEETRFVLEGGKEDNDFIHANKVIFKYGEGMWRRYFIALAPIKDTMEDFWRMVYQFRSGIMVVLGPFKENGKELQEQFWPETTGEKKKVFGRMIVTEQYWRNFGSFIFTTLAVKTAEGESERFIQLYHFHSFTPTLPPSDALFASEGLRDIRMSASMIVVSGSGTSRACSFVLTHALLAHLWCDVPTSLEEIATELRRQRAMSFHNNKKCFYYAVCETLLYIKHYEGHCTSDVIPTMLQRYKDEEWKKE